MQKREKIAFSVSSAVRIEISSMDRNIVTSRLRGMTKIANPVPAASQTVAQMARQGLVTLTPGSDARHRIVGLTTEAERLLPTLDAEWAATATAATALEAELSMPLSALVAEVLDALDRRPMRDRIRDTGLLPG